MTQQPLTIDYTSYDIDALQSDLITLLQNTQTFKDVNLPQSNINNWITIVSWIGALNGYYINSAANEVFLPTAKRYKNLNKIAQMLRYDARGVTSSLLNVIGSMSPNYVFGKTGQYIEIPSYSIFPSTKPTTSGTNFQFTNITSKVQVVQGLGISTLTTSDISYNNYSLPFTAPASFFQNPQGNIVINPLGISLPLSLQRPLSIINIPDSNNYYGYDITNYPLFDPTNSNSVGQPFVQTIPTIASNATMVPNTPYYLIFNWDKNTSNPYISISSANDVGTLGDKANDILMGIILQPTDDTNTNYTLGFYEDGTVNRFFLGVLGLSGLSSTQFNFDYFSNNPNSIQQINLVINQDGSLPPLVVLVNGSIYTFNSGTISSQQFTQNFFSSNVPVYNVNLVIANPSNPGNNYDARLEVTANAPLSNQITIATINTNFTDNASSTPALQTSSSTTFGNLQVVAPIPPQASEQKAGTVIFASGETSQQVFFQSPFVIGSNEVKVEYSIQLTPSDNIRTWFSNSDENGFIIYVEPNTQFAGVINWTASRIIQENIKQTDVVFDTPMPLGISQAGLTSNYMVQLTPNDNIQVWYENPTSTGFSIKTEKSFTGNVSWSIFNYFQNDTVPSEPESGYRQIGSVVLTPNQTSINITLTTPITDTNYAIQLVPDANIVVFYTNKTSTGFTINIEPGITNQTLTVNWYVDSSTGYSFQRHGEVSFSGSVTSAATIPGLRFSNIPETFAINNLLQGSVTFSYVNVNEAIDPNNNGLNLSIDPNQLTDNVVRYIVNNDAIAINSIRVFVKNNSGTWDEWTRTGTGFNVNIAVGELVFFVRANPDQLITIDFGDGINYGTSPLNQETIIIGLNSVGSDGNINKSTLSPQVIVSQYILGNDQTDINFESNFIELLGLKSQQYFSGSSPQTSLVDSQGTVLSNTDFSIIQNQNAAGGNNVETVDELRRNATNYFTSQGRNVSESDTANYVMQVFNDYVVLADVLDYEEAQAAGILTASQISQYWFNYVFVIILNADGTNTISKSLNDLIVTNLDSDPVKCIGKKHVLIPATWVPIDVLVRFKAKSYGNPDIIESQIKQLVSDYFTTYTNFTLGQTIENSYIGNLVGGIDAVDSYEVMLNANRGNKLTASDYVTNITTVYDTQVETDMARKNALMALVTKNPSLVRIFQPLFSSLNTNGTTSWDYSLQVILGAYEFPQLGNIVIELQQ